MKFLIATALLMSSGLSFAQPNMTVYCKYGSEPVKKITLVGSAGYSSANLETVTVFGMEGSEDLMLQTYADNIEDTIQVEGRGYVSLNRGYGANRDSISCSFNKNDDHF